MADIVLLHVDCSSDFHQPMLALNALRSLHLFPISLMTEIACCLCMACFSCLFCEAVFMCDGLLIKTVLFVSQLKSAFDVEGFEFLEKVVGEKWKEFGVSWKRLFSCLDCSAVEAEVINALIDSGRFFCSFRMCCGCRISTL